MSKKLATRDHILGKASLIAGELGLEGMSIGILAKLTGLSKSGVYAHFDSKEALQIALLDHVADQIAREVFRPAFREPRGLPRLRAIFENWLQWKAGEFDNSCLFAAASSEFDDRHGPVRSRVKLHIAAAIDSFRQGVRLAIETGDLAKETDPDAFAFEMWSILGGFEQFVRLLDDDRAWVLARQSFERLIAQSRGFSITKSRDSLGSAS